jgi:hypothetical protein
MRRARQAIRPTFPRVRQVCDGLCHDDGNLNTAVRLVHSEFEKDVVQHMLHHVPVADDSGAGLEGASNVSSRGRVGVAVGASKGKRLAELSVAILGHDGRDAESRLRIEGPAGAHGGGS